MNIAVVTTFNNKLYKKYAYRFMETYNWDFDLHVYSENAIPGSYIDYIDLYSVPGCKEFVERNAERSAKDAQVSYKFDSVRFSYKIYAYTDFILNKAKDYDGVICIDADSVFYKPIGSKWIKEHIHRDDCMMGYLGRAGYYSECGFLYFNMNHKDTLDYAAEMKKMYDTDSLYKEKEYHDSWIWDVVRNRFEKNKGTKNFNIGDNAKGHVQARSPLGKIYDHTKGKRKVSGVSPEFKRI